MELSCFLWVECSSESRDSAVNIATAYGLDDQGVGSSSPGRVKNFLFSTHHPDRLWGPPNLLSNVYQGTFPRA
jgi:hypothetical protein